MREQEFIAAQTAALAVHGVKARQCFVDTPVVEGRTQVLVAGSGPPVVLLNGIGTPAAMFAPLMARLERFTLYAVDLPGFGLTDTKAGLADDLRATAVAFLDQVLEALGLDQPAILANSLGSLWASWLALEQPSRVRALVHVGCPAIILDTAAPLPMRLLSVPLLGRLMMRLLPPSESQVEQLSKMVREYPLPPETADLLLATERLPACEESFLAMLNALLRLRGPRPEMVLTGDQLARIDAPTLLIFARNDPMGAERAGRRVAEAMPDAELHIVDGGHAPWIHHADQIAPLIAEFLGRRDLLAA